jgi:ubiquitin-like 1-activating enzyme E1 A
MAKAKVLYIHMTGVSVEVLKNLVLAGIQPSICDDRPFPDAMIDTPCFLLTGRELMEPAPKKQKQTVADALKSHIEALNPLLEECQVVTSKLQDIDIDVISQFRVVVASRIPPNEAIRLSKLTASSGGTFFLVDSFGMHGASLFDLGPNCTYKPEQGKKLLDETKLKIYVDMETALQKVRLEQATNRFWKTSPAAWIKYKCILEYAQQTGNFPTEDTADQFVTIVREWVETTVASFLEHELVTEESLRQLAKVATCEIAPVCAVMGGAIGNEVIKAISGKGEPANNTMLFDGFACKCQTFLIQPK